MESGVVESELAQNLRELAPTSASEVCLHCGQPVLTSDEEGFCCRGCRVVHGLLRKGGLGRYYELRGGPGTPVADLGLERRDHHWLAPLEERVAAGGGHVSLDVQGIHCAACVWLMEELFRRQDGAIHVLVNPALGRLDLAVGPAFPLASWVSEVEQLGYLLGPALKRDEGATDGLLLRMGICLALAGNSMFFAAAIYFGLSEGPVYELLGQIGYAAAVLAVLVGGSVFLRSAWAGLRRGLVHLDLPIALGIALAFGGATYTYFWGRGEAAYVDTLTVFIALMVTGRWVQERVLERNRHRLLSDDGVDGLRCRRVAAGRVGLVPCRELAEGDELLLSPGDLVPVDAELLDPEATLSLDWIDGESRPRPFAEGETLPAGAFLAGRRAVRARSLTGFEASPLIPLLRTTRRGDGGERADTPWWRRLGTAYVIAVLAAASAGFLGHLLATGDALRAVEVATAILVVTCPCAFGIATPLAYELVQSRLRRAGLFVRTRSFLERAREVRRVVFDKTGTLTTGRLVLDDEAPLDALPREAQADLFDLASRSTHPKSVALARALEKRGHTLRPEVLTEEHPGAGLSATLAGRTHRLGTMAFAAAAPGATDEDLVYAVDGQVLVALRTRESLRPDAARELRRLEAEGYQPVILSGDAKDAVTAMARTLGLPEERALGGMKPDAKAAWVRANDPEHTLMVGDGLNDSLAVEVAGCSGTPAVDRPFMASRCDFYFVTPGLGPVTQSLRDARALARVVRRNLAFAVAYNAAAVSVALAGLMQPWLAAVLMPASSLVTLAYTAAALGPRRTPWTS